MASFDSPPMETEVWMTEGETRSFPFRYGDGTISNDANDLTNSTLSTQVSKTPKDSALFTASTTITTAASGLYSVSVLSTNFTTDGLTAGRWWMETRLTDSGGNPTIISKVHLKIKPSVFVT